MKKAGLLILGVLIGGAAAAGKYEDEQTFVLQDADTAVIRAQVTTIPTRSGNESSLVLYVDGIEVDRVGGPRAEHTLTHRWTAKGKHVVRAVCSNQGADAKTCEISVTAEDVKRL